jgi:hypothetical protein
MMSKILDKDGNPTTLGKLSKEERRQVFVGAVLNAKSYFARPDIKAALAATPVPNQTKH